MHDLRALRLHQLEGFYYVATHQGFTRAAEAMPYPITEPALHQQVRKLERALGLTLLVKGARRRMALTPEARALYRFVAPYFEQLPGVLRDLTRGAGGELVVGTESLYLDGLCGESLAAVQRKRPRARLQLRERDGAEIAAAILRGEIDVGITSTATPLPKGVEFESLGALGLQLLVPAGHPLSRKRPPLRPEHLAEHAFIVYEPGSEARSYTEEALLRTGVVLRVAAEASSAAAMRALVASGLAPAFVPALGKRPRRKTLPDGSVAYDLTGMLREAAGLPGFGLIRRPGPAEGLLGAFCEAARAVVGS